jgi:hypothetical protein
LPAESEPGDPVERVAAAVGSPQVSLSDGLELRDLCADSTGKLVPGLTVLATNNHLGKPIEDRSVGDSMQSPVTGDPRGNLSPGFDTQEP